MMDTTDDLEAPLLSEFEKKQKMPRSYAYAAVVPTTRATFVLPATIVAAVCIFATITSMNIATTLAIVARHA